MIDIWTATNGLGRTIVGDVRSPRINRFVGMFYFLWMGFETTDDPYDVSKTLKAHPNAMQEPNNTAWGPSIIFIHFTNIFQKKLIIDTT